MASDAPAISDVVPEAEESQGESADAAERATIVLSPARATDVHLSRLAEVDKLALTGELNADQRALVQQRVTHSMQMLDALRRTGRKDLRDRLLEHERAILLSELGSDKQRMLDDVNLPGSLNFQYDEENVP